MADAGERPSRAECPRASAPVSLFAGLCRSYVDIFIVVDGHFDPQGYLIILTNSLGPFSRRRLCSLPKHHFQHVFDRRHRILPFLPADDSLSLSKQHLQLSSRHG